jgi:hypothetical protein
MENPDIIIEISSKESGDIDKVEIKIISEVMYKVDSCVSILSALLSSSR